MTTKNKAKHTPGPWEVFDYPGEKGFKERYQIRQVGDTLVTIAVNARYGYNAGAVTSPEIAQANARLIAAAPEMEQCLNSIGSMLIMANRPQDKPMINYIKRILAKIEGK